MMSTRKKKVLKKTTVVASYEARTLIQPVLQKMQYLKKNKKNARLLHNRVALPAMQCIKRYTIALWHSNRKIVACRKGGKE